MPPRRFGKNERQNKENIFLLDNSLRAAVIGLSAEWLSFELK